MRTAAGSAARRETAHRRVDFSETIAPWQAGFVAERPLPS